MRRTCFALAAGVWLAACDESGSGCSGDSNRTTSTGGSTSSGGTTSLGGTGGGTVNTGGGGTGTTGGGGMTDTGGTTSGGGSMPTGQCGRRCTVDADCCPAGAMGCPGPYPLNFSCVDLDGDGEKSCRAPECMSDMDCTNGAGVYVCKSISNFIKACITPCQVDGDCNGSTKCAGLADDGTAYCKIDAPPFSCTSNGSECDGSGVCAPSGDSCVCSNDTQCDDNLYTSDCIGGGK